MKEFRSEDRLIEDRRMLKIYDAADFALFPRARELGFTGMIYTPPAPITSHSADEINRLKSPAQKEYDVSFPTGSFILTKLFEMAKEGVPRTYWKGMNTLSAYHALAFPQRRETSIRLRFNSDYPQPEDQPHHFHEATMTYSLKGDGTILKNEEGGFYKPPANSVVLIGDYQAHYAPARQSDNDTTLERINFIVG